MSKKVELTYQDAFIVAHGLSELFEEKMDGKTAAFLYKFSRSFKTLVEDYNAACELTGKKEEEVIKVNNSVFCEVETFSIGLLESLNLKPATLVKLDKVLE